MLFSNKSWSIQIHHYSPFLFQFLLRCQDQVISDRLRGDSRINVAQLGTPKNTRPARTEVQTRPTHYPLVKRTESPSILGLQAPALSRCLDLLIPIYNPPSVGPDGAGTHDKRITSLSSPHPLVYARDKEICDLTTIQMQRSVLNRLGQGNNVTQWCPVGRRTPLVTSTTTKPHPCPVTISPAFISMLTIVIIMITYREQHHVVHANET
jgi:hypothetical protein